jgi:hypothetical protein
MGVVATALERRVLAARERPPGVEDLVDEPASCGIHRGDGTV